MRFKCRTKIDGYSTLGIKTEEAANAGKEGITQSPPGTEAVSGWLILSSFGLFSYTVIVYLL